MGLKVVDTVSGGRHARGSDLRPSACDCFPIQPTWQNDSRASWEHRPANQGRSSKVHQDPLHSSKNGKPIHSLASIALHWSNGREISALACTNSKCLSSMFSILSTLKRTVSQIFFYPRYTIKSWDETDTSLTVIGAKGFGLRALQYLSLDYLHCLQLSSILKILASLVITRFLIHWWSLKAAEGSKLAWCNSVTFTTMSISIQSMVSISGKVAVLNIGFHSQHAYSTIQFQEKSFVWEGPLRFQRQYFTYSKTPLIQCFTYQDYNKNRVSTVGGSRSWSSRAWWPCQAFRETIFQSFHRSHHSWWVSRCRAFYLHWLWCQIQRPWGNESPVCCGFQGCLLDWPWCYSSDGHANSCRWMEQGKLEWWAPSFLPFFERFKLFLFFVNQSALSPPTLHSRL